MEYYTILHWTLLVPMEYYYSPLDSTCSNGILLFSIGLYLFQWNTTILHWTPLVPMEYYYSPLDSTGSNGILLF
ncbi:hypothetical protein QZH41_004856 [Actinostola sp. cb2023]|nr:hypothetical protein QZH41_004856 [Actinostola sp. cb2023]